MSQQADLKQVGAGQDGELVLGVAVMGADPLEDVPGAAQQLLGEVGRHLLLQPLHLHLLCTLGICCRLHPLAWVVVRSNNNIKQARRRSEWKRLT